MADIAEHIDWFLRTYPTPDARLRYSNALRRAWLASRAR